MTCFLFHLKPFLSWLFGHVKKQLNEKDKVNFKVMTSQPKKKQLECTYCPISHEVKATRQWNFVS